MNGQLLPRSTLADRDETFVDGNSLLQQMSSQTYTAYNLFNDCAQRGKKLLQDHQSGKQHSLRKVLNSISATECSKIGNSNTYRDAFAALASELEDAAEALIPINIPQFGTFGYRMFNLGITIPFFDLNPKYADKYKLVRESKKSLHQRGGGDNKNQPVLQRLNTQRCAKMTNISQSLYKELLSCIWNRLGKIMNTGSVVDIDFKVGTLTSEDRCPTFQFTQRLDPLPKNKFSGLRTTLNGRSSSNSNNQKQLPKMRVTVKDNGGHRIPSSPSLARIPNASRTVRVGVTREPISTTSVNLSFRRGAEGSGYYKKKQPTRPSENKKKRKPFFGEQRTIVEVVDVEDQRTASSSSSSETKEPYSPTSRLTYGPTHSPGKLRNGTTISKEYTSLMSSSSTTNPISPALLDLYCRTRCATYEDVVLIRSAVDRIGSHYSPSATALAINMHTGLISYRRDTKLKSAWQKQLENKVDVKWNIGHQFMNGAGSSSTFQVLNIEDDHQMVSRQPPLNLQKQLKMAYTQLDEAFHKAKMKSKSAIERNLTIVNSSSTTTTPAAANVTSPVVSGAVGGDDFHRIIGNGYSTGDAVEDSKMLVYVLKVQLNVMYKKILLFNQMIVLSRKKQMNLDLRLERHGNGMDYVDEYVLDSETYPEHHVPTSSSGSNGAAATVVAAATSQESQEGTTVSIEFDKPTSYSLSGRPIESNLFAGHIHSLNNDKKYQLLQAHVRHDVLSRVGWLKMEDQCADLTKNLQDDILIQKQMIEKHENIIFMDEYNVTKERNITRQQTISSSLSSPNMFTDKINASIQNEIHAEKTKTSDTITNMMNIVELAIKHHAAVELPKDDGSTSELANELKREEESNAATNSTIHVLKGQMLHDIERLTKETVEIDDGNAGNSSRTDGKVTELKEKEKQILFMIRETTTDILLNYTKDTTANINVYLSNDGTSHGIVHRSHLVHQEYVSNSSGGSGSGGGGGVNSSSLSGGGGGGGGILLSILNGGSTSNTSNSKRKRRSKRTYVNDGRPLTPRTATVLAHAPPTNIVNDDSESQKNEKKMRKEQRQQLQTQPEHNDDNIFELTKPTAIERYWQYIENGIDERLLAPMEVKWLKNAMKKLSDDVRVINNDTVMTQQILEELLLDIDQRYRISVRTSIVDYILMK
jgi:hypothetical protein